MAANEVKANTKKILKEAKEYETHSGHYIYFLLKSDMIVYVGQSHSLGVRISNHKKGKDFDRVKYIEVPKHNQNVLELALIKSIKPAYNTQPLGPMTENEIKMLREYQFEEQTIAEILRSQPTPERHAYGYVGYFDDDGNPQVGYYDGEDELEEHEPCCRMGQCLEIIEDKVSEILFEGLCDYCNCEPEAIVMVGFLTYKNIFRDELFVVDAPEFQPFREKFDTKFFDGYEKGRANGNTEETNHI